MAIQGISKDITAQDSARTITLELYPQEFWILDQAERVTGIRTRSATIRHMINDWARRNLVVETTTTATLAPLFDDGYGNTK